MNIPVIYKNALSSSMVIKNVLMFYKPILFNKTQPACVTSYYVHVKLCFHVVKPALYV